MSRYAGNLRGVASASILVTVWYKTLAEATRICCNLAVPLPRFKSGTESCQISASVTMSKMSSSSERRRRYPEKIRVRSQLYSKSLIVLTHYDAVPLFLISIFRYNLYNNIKVLILYYTYC